MDMFVSVEEAESIIRQLYMSNSNEVTAWSELSIPDKGVLLTQATNYMNSIQYKGVVVDVCQPLAFPRWFECDLIELNDDIRRACVEWCVWKLCCDDSRLSLQRQGVTSVKVGNNSESYGGFGITVPYSVDVFLKPYRATSFVVD